MYKLLPQMNQVKRPNDERPCVMGLKTDQALRLSKPARRGLLPRDPMPGECQCHAGSALKPKKTAWRSQALKAGLDAEILSKSRAEI